MPQIEHIDTPEHALESLSLLFKALSDPARIRIVNLLAAQGELCNCHIEEVTGYGSSKISRHFSYLKQSNLIQSRRDGLWIYYSLKPISNPVHGLIHQAIDLFPELYPVLRQDIENMKVLLCKSC